jgi:hypothetical protein
MSLDASIWAWKQQVGKSSAKLVLLSLADRADVQDQSFPSVETLSADTELNRKTVIDALRHLKQIGLIKDSGARRGESGRVIVYQLVGVEQRTSGPRQSRKRDSPENGTVPKTGQSRKRDNPKPTTINTPEQSMDWDSPENGTVPKTDGDSPENGTRDSPENGTQNLSVEPITEPEEIFTAPPEQSTDDEAAPADAVDGTPVPEPDPDDDFYLTKNRKKLRGELLDRFNRFWEAYDYRKGKAEAADAWLAKVPWTKSPEQNNALLARILVAAEFEALQRPAKVAIGTTPIYPEGWLSGRRWEDESVDLAANQAAGSKNNQRRDVSAALMDIHDTDW